MAGPQISTTEQPAPQGVTDFRPDEGGTMPLADRAFQAQQAFSDPNFLREAAIIAFKNRQPQGFEFLERSAKVAKENGFEAVGHLLRGDGPAALSAFNRSGSFNDATGAKDNGDGTWTITRKSGATVQIDPKTQIESYLNPRDYVTWKRNQDDTAQRASELAETKDFNSRRLSLMQQQAEQQGKYQEGMNEARKTAAEAAATRAEAAAAQAEARIAGGVGGAGGTRGGATRRGAASSYVDSRMKVTEKFIGEGLKGAELAQEVDKALEFYTQVARDPRGDGYILVADAHDNPTVIDRFETIEEANAAKASWLSGKGIPKKAPKPPVEDKGPYAPGEGRNQPPKSPRRLSGFDAYRQSAIDAQKPKPSDDLEAIPDEMTRMMGGYSSATAPVEAPVAQAKPAAQPSPAQRSLSEVQAEIRRLSKIRSRTPQEEANLQSLFKAQAALSKGM